MGRIEHLIQSRRLERRAAATAYRADPLERTPVPLGRLGRLLLTDIERYLEFFEIACADAPGDRTPPAP